MELNSNTCQLIANSKEFNNSDVFYSYVPFKQGDTPEITQITIKQENIEELPVVEEVEIHAVETEEVIGDYAIIEDNIEIKREPSEDIKKNELKVILLQRIPVENSKETKLFTCPQCNECFYNWEDLLVHEESHIKPGKHLCYVCGKTFRKLKNYKKHMLLKCDKPFDCKNCSLRFRKSYDLRKHFYNTHIARRSLECFFCYRRFSKRDVFKSHIVCHIGGEPFKCTLCSQSFYGSWLLKYHYKEDHQVDNNTDLKCSDCNVYFISEKHLMDHMKTHSSVKPNLCHICGQIFGSEIMLTKHMASHFSNQKWRCNKCHKSFLHESMLKNHLRKHYLDRPFLCNVCGKGFGTVAHLSRHEQIHSEEKNFKCTNCDKAFNQKQSLSYHLKKCNYAFSVETKQCYRCDTPFSKLGCSFSEHLKQHEMEDKQARKDRNKPTSCPVCSKVVHCEKYLKLHMNSHSGLKPFPCDVCSRCFSTPGNLLRHKEIHSEIKRFLCSMCGRRFHQKQTLSAHIRSHLGIKRYQCQICDRRFSEGRSLKRHLARHDEDSSKEGNVYRGRNVSKEGNVYRGRNMGGERNEYHGNVYQCTGCEEKFYSEETVLEHIQTCSTDNS